MVVLDLKRKNTTLKTIAESLTSNNLRERIFLLFCLFEIVNSA